MMENGKRRARRQLSPEEKWELFLEVTSQEISQADAARKYGVDVSVIIRLRALAKDAALAAFASPLKQPMNRAATRITVLERARVSEPLTPAVRADVSEVEYPAAAGVRPPVGDCSINQPQKLELGPGAHARGNRAEKPERCLPR